MNLGFVTVYNEQEEKQMEEKQNGSSEEDYPFVIDNNFVRMSSSWYECDEFRYIALCRWKYYT